MNFQTQGSSDKHTNQYTTEMTRYDVIYVPRWTSNCQILEENMFHPIFTNDSEQRNTPQDMRPLSKY
jgi:hypothetical protein